MNLFPKIQRRKVSEMSWLPNKRILLQKEVNQATTKISFTLKKRNLRRKINSIIPPRTWSWKLARGTVKHQFNRVTRCYKRISKSRPLFIIDQKTRFNNKAWESKWIKIDIRLVQNNILPTRNCCQRTTMRTLNNTNTANSNRSSKDWRKKRLWSCVCWQNNQSKRKNLNK